MAQRGQRGKAVAHVGNNRGGHTVVEMVPATAANGVTTWECIDPKPGRAAALARVVGERFPGIRSLAREVDGRDVPRRLAEDAVIVSTVDTVHATLDLIASRQSGQSLVFQLLGRGTGPAMAAPQLGIAGAITDGRTQAEARLLFEGLATIAADASSRVLTHGGSPVTAALLQPMRRVTTRQSLSYFADVVERRTTDWPLSFFTSSSHRFPLVVRPWSTDVFSAEKAYAVEALDALVPHRGSVVAAVALVSIEMIDIFFVHQSRTDRRYADRVLSLRAEQGRDANFTD